VCAGVYARACVRAYVDEELRQRMYSHTAQFCEAVETLLGMHQTRLMASLSAADTSMTSLSAADTAMTSLSAADMSADDVTYGVMTSFFSVTVALSFRLNCISR